MSRIEDLGIFMISDAMQLLRDAMFALENTKTQVIPDGTGQTTKDLGNSIRALLTGGQDNE